MPKVTFAETGTTGEVPILSTLVEVCREFGSSVFFGCGSGACGSCRIRIPDYPENVSAPTPEEKDFLSFIGAASDERLACQCSVLGDFTLVLAQA